MRSYYITSQGEATCGTSETDPGTGWSDARIGCVNSAISQSACNGPQLTWITRATSATQCDSYMRCQEASKSTLTPKTQAACLSCNGSWVSAFNWHTGQWLNGAVVPLQWKPKTFGPVNTWAPGLPFTNQTVWRLVTFLLQPIGAKMAYSAKSLYLCKYNSIVGVLQNLASDCSGVAKKRSVTTSGGFVVAQNRIFSQISQTTFGFGVTANTYSYTLGVDTSEMTITDYPLGQLSSQLSNSSLILNIPVNNALGIQIGQAVTDGYSVSFNPTVSAGTYTLCAQIRLDVTSNACYNVPDLATLNGNGVLTPMQATISSYNDGEICASLSTSQTGPFYGVQRTLNYVSQSTNPCPVSATTGSVGSTTTGSAPGSGITWSSVAALCLSCVLCMII